MGAPPPIDSAARCSDAAPRVNTATVPGSTIGRPGGRTASDGMHAAARGIWERLPLAPLLLAALLLAFLLAPPVRGSAGYTTAFLGASGFLAGWSLLLWVLVRRGGRCFAIELAPPRPQHYIQASVQICIYIYWGWYWRDVYANAPLFLAQFVFLYAFDALLTWTRGRPWRLGFGPLPIILSTNVFIWFREDWYSYQFLLVALGALGKEFVRWTRDGRRTHIFNPSAFTLAIFSVVLLVTDATDATWAERIATTFTHPPYIFTVVFCLGLIVQHFFSITLMTLGAALTLLLLNEAYTAVTGTYFFVFQNLTAPVFLGFHLLVTDPSTSPRTHAGRLIFGSLYGLLVFLFFGLFQWLELPTVYDKLLPVPLLNLSVQVIDRWAGRGVFGALGRFEKRFRPRAVNLGLMGLWTGAFVTAIATGYLQAPHEGTTIQFWKTAVEEGRFGARKGLLEVLSFSAREGSSVAWNELGVIYLAGELTEAQPQKAANCFARASVLGNLAGSANLASMYLGAAHGEPGREVMQALDQLEAACAGDVAGDFYYLVGLAYETGRGKPQDPQRAREFFKRGCSRGSFQACEGLSRVPLQPATEGPGPQSPADSQ